MSENQEVPRLYAVEFTDDEGDQVIRHEFMTPQQARRLLDEMIKREIQCQICDLSATPTEKPPDVFLLK